jgi:hypothetical protein
VTDVLPQLGRASIAAAVGPTSRVSPCYWVPTLLAALAVTRWRNAGQRRSLVVGLFPGGEGTRRSHLVDQGLNV